MANDTVPSRRSPARWVIALLVLVLVCYAVSPYFCFWRFTEALKARDRDRLAFYVDFRGVRDSVKQQWHDRLAQKGGADSGSKADQIASMINAVAPNLVDQVIDMLVTPEGIISVLEHPQAARDPQELASVTKSGGGGRGMDLSNLRHAWFAGVRDFTVEDEGVKLHFKFSKWRWRLLDIDLGLTGR